MITGCMIVIFGYSGETFPDIDEREPSIESNKNVHREITPAFFFLIKSILQIFNPFQLRSTTSLFIIKFYFFFA